MCIGGVNQHSDCVELTYIRAHQIHCGPDSKLRFPMTYFAGLLRECGIVIRSESKDLIVCEAAPEQVWRALR